VVFILARLCIPFFFYRSAIVIAPFMMPNGASKCKKSVNEFTVAARAALTIGSRRVRLCG
jgi:hypothetical protein